MSRILITILIVVFAGNIKAQLSKTERLRLEEAEELFTSQDYLSTRLLIEPLVSIHQGNAQLLYLMGHSSMMLSSYKQEAALYLKRAFELGYARSFLPYAKLLLESNNPYAASKVLEHIDSTSNETVELLSKQCNNAIESYDDEGAMFVESVGSMINSDYVEHTPLISFNDSSLFFTSRRPIDENAVTDFSGEYDENIFWSMRTDSGWTNARSIAGGVNGLLNDATVSLNTETNQMIVFRTSRDLESSDLWIAEEERGEWRLKKRLSEPINSDYIENSASFSRNSNAYYVSSDRPGGFGGFDIYRVVVFANGDLSQPQNLGPQINGPYDEIAPFMLPDDRTLFFSSDCEESIGGFDFFSSQIINDTTWTLKENLGRPICSSADDVHINISWSGGKAYFARAKTTNAGDLDIYSSNLPGFNMHANVYRGKIKNMTPNSNVEIRLFTGDYSETVGVYTADKNGEFIVVLLPGEKGLLEIQGNDFKPLTKSLDFVECDGLLEIPFVVELEKLAH